MFSLILNFLKSLISLESDFTLVQFNKFQLKCVSGSSSLLKALKALAKKLVCTSLIVLLG